MASTYEERQRARKKLASYQFSFNKALELAHSTPPNAYISQRLEVLKIQLDTYRAVQPNCKEWMNSDRVVCPEPDCDQQFQAEYVALVAQLAADIQLLRYNSLGYLWEESDAFEALKVINVGVPNGPTVLDPNDLLDACS